MKKALSLILALIMCLSLCACGSVEENTEEPTTETNASDETISICGWQAVDSVHYITALSFGTFSNTATSSSDLTVDTVVIRDTDTKHYYVSFHLLEYGDTPVTYSSSDEDDIQLKIKIGDLVEEFDLFGFSPNGDLLLAQGDALGVDFAGDYLFNLLLHGIDVRCIISIASSKYNFTISSKNFVNASIDAGFTPKEWLDGRIVSTISPPPVFEFITTFANGEKNTSRFWDYFYDAEGRLIKAVSTEYLDGTTTYTYDDSGKLISSQTEKGWMGDEGDGNTCTTITEYNEHGDPAKEIKTYRCPGNWPRQDGEIETTIYEYEYYDDGTVKSQKPYVDGELSWRWRSYSYEYSASGQLLKTEEQVHSDGKVSVWITTYTYNEAGTMISSSRTITSDNILLETVFYGDSI